MLRKPLGRGLDALIERARPEPMPETNGSNGAHGAHENGLAMVAPDEIAPSPFQPRSEFNAEKLQELANAIANQGIIEPLVVRPIASDSGPARYELICGERRLRAAKMARLDAVPVIVRELDDRHALEMSLVENLVRENLGLIDEANAFVRLNKEFALTHEQIAERIGKSRVYVTNAIRALNLPREIIEMIARGELTIGQARPLLAMESMEEQLAAALEIVSAGITARGAERLANHASRRRSGRAPSEQDANMTALADSIQRAMRRKVRIVKPRGKAPGRVELEYYDDDDLTALAESLMQASS